MAHIHIHIALLLALWIVQRPTTEKPASDFGLLISLHIKLYVAAVGLAFFLDPSLAGRVIREQIAAYRKLTEYFATQDRFPEQIASLVNFYASSPRSSGVTATPTSTTTTGNRSRYTYSSLAGKNHIRLLLLWPASTPEVPLRGYLLPIHVGDENPSYAALSYCWNDCIYSSPVDGEMCIFLEDLPSLPKEYYHVRPLPANPLPLTPNLVNALRAIRDDVSCIAIWVDQICINQADIDERSSQVALMDHIYTNARYVQIWIGDDTQDRSVAKAFDLARHLGSFGSRLRKLFGPSSRVGDYDVDVQTCRKYGIPLLQEAMSEYATLVSLVCRPWFSRSWIVQEVALNENIKVSCGSSEITFITLWTAISFCYQQFPSSIGPVPRNMYEAYGSLSLAFPGSIARGRRNLLAVLVDHRYCLSTEARDKVFAFLSIAVDAHDLGIVADYSLCARSVFTKTAAKIIRHYPNLDILSYATPWPHLEISEGNGIALGKCKDATKRCQDTSHPLTLPSWAPDWSTMVDCDSLRPIGPVKRVINFSATGDSRHKPQFRKNDTQLGLQGIIIDQVAQVSRTLGLPLSERCAFLKDAETMARVRNTAVYEPTGESMWDAFFKTITGGDEMLATTCGRASYRVTTEDSPVLFEKESFHERYQKFLGQLHVARCMAELQSKNGVDWIICKLVYWIVFLWENRSVWYDPRHEALSERFGLGILGRNTNRRFMRSTKGYIGLAGPQAKPGDYIALFAGGAVPIMIRPKGKSPDSTSLWEIVGDVYVHGVMFGEAFNVEKCEMMWIV
ncbi:hypothetical protein MRS44_011547 [Fusarium solani]|uniref:uncharacterized protein n=1 Tax=Fusarium solani TaxID=169388 RepID=UPI0032C4A75C|nr:hypothetical protein MRS44_011547 [Fusarium solani]